MTTLLPTIARFPKGQGYGARLGNLYVRVAADREMPLRIYTQDSLAERRDDQGSFYENVLDLGYAWARTQWRGGEGLDWDPPDRTLAQGELSLDGIKFWDSELLDIAHGEPGQPYTLALVKKFQDWGGATTTPVDLTVSDDQIFIADDDTVSWYPDWTTFTADDSHIFGTSDPIAIAAAPSGVCMAITVDGHIHVRAQGSTSFADLYTPTGNRDALGVWYVKGRFIVAFVDTDVDSHELSEVTTTDAWVADLTEAVIDTADAAFWSVVDSGPAVVSACGDGTVRTYTPFLDDSLPANVGQLIPRGRTPVPTGESAYLLGDINGILFILTSAPNADDPTTFDIFAYMSEVLDGRFDYSVGSLQLQRSWIAAPAISDVTGAVVSRRDELMFPIAEASGLEYLWRFDAVTLGMSRHQKLGLFESSGLVTYEGIIGGRNDNDDVVHVDILNFEDEGYVISPNVTFGLNTDLNWVASVVEAFSLGDGAQIEIFRTTDPEAINDPDDPNWIIIRRLSSDQQSGVEVPMVGVTSRTLAMMVKLKANNSNDTTPELSRLAIRGMPKHRDWIIELPVNVSDVVEAHGRVPVRIPDWGNTIHRGLLDLQGTHLEIELYDPPLLFRGIVSSVLEPVTWISPRGASSARCIVELRGNRIVGETSGTPTGDAGTGIGLTGVATTGIGQSGVL